jgi:hypothetical protein
LLGFALAACVDTAPPVASAHAPAPRAASEAPPKAKPRAGTGDPAQGSEFESAAADQVEVLDPGTPPRRRLRYAFSDGAERDYWIRAEVSWLDDHSTLSTTKGAPLRVEQLGDSSASAGSYRLSLGPLQVQRWSTEQPVVVEQGDSALRARVNVDARGAIVEVRDPRGDASLELNALWDSLLDRDVLPNPAVGMGARWKQERRFEGGHRIVSEFELIELRGEVLTLRVWREQRVEGAADSSLKTIGEWTIALSSWPPVGIDRVYATGPGPDAKRMQASFSIMNNTGTP